MGFLTNRFIKSLLGIVLLCVFTLRPCAALVRNVSVLKNLSVMEKGIEESSKESKENKQNKGRYLPEYDVPAGSGSAVVAIPVNTSRPLILSEIHGCSGPILRIQTPPPDPVSRF